jgi:CubicO group peptidase (beta-lactamase class C family)
MYDPYASREITIRDLLAHRSGLGLGQGELDFCLTLTFPLAKLLSGSSI